MTETTDTLQRFLNDIGKVPLLTAAQEVELAKRIEAGDTTAKNRLVEANLRLVVKIAKTHQNKGLPFLDLIQEGSLGLSRAAEKFDYRKGNKFSTYAVPWIKQSIRRGLDNYSRTVRIPVHREVERRRIERIERDLMSELGTDPTIEEIADAADVPADAIVEMRKYAQATVSLDKPLGDDPDGGVLGDIIPDEEDVFNELITLEGDTEFVDRLLERLSKSERRLLEMRYGLHGYEPHTLREIGEIFGFTHEAIRLFEKDTLNLLREFIEEDD